MKTRLKLSTLILMISIGCSVYSQTSELIVELIVIGVSGNELRVVFFVIV
jgi:hypothetical protein